jgi:hypothetical protein
VGVADTATVGESAGMMEKGSLRWKMPGPPTIIV